MTSIPTMHKIALAVMALYGLVTIAGGILGYVQKTSYHSVISGSIAGLLLLGCALGMFRKPFWSSLGALIVSLALGGFFISRVVRAKPSPENNDTISTIAHAVGPVMIAGSVMVIVTAVLALVFSSGTADGK